MNNLHIALASVLMASAIASHAADKLKGDPAKAKPIIDEKCSACHGPDGNSPVPNFPRLAGQHAEYLFKELKAFKEEHRGSELMLPFSKELSEDDMANLAVYFSQQTPGVATVTRPELLAAGKKLYLEGNPVSGVPSCDGCHEEDGKGSAKFPSIAAQNVEYTLEEFRRYRSGDRKHGSKQMRTIGQRLTPEEIEALAQYMASLK
jgi:cytochrome c553